MVGCCPSNSAGTGIVAGVAGVVGVAARPLSARFAVTICVHEGPLSHIPDQRILSWLRMYISTMMKAGSRV